MYLNYVLRCIDSKGSRKKFYVGITDDLLQRLDAHKSGSTKTTRGFDKIELVYYEACFNKTDAIRREKQLKTGFGRGYLKRRLEHYLKNLRE